MNFNIGKLIFLTIFLTSCGQSGALYLPENATEKDKNDDFLLYKKKDKKQKTENLEVPPNEVEETTTLD